MCQIHDGSTLRGLSLILLGGGILLLHPPAEVSADADGVLPTGLLPKFARGHPFRSPPIILIMTQAERRSRHSGWKVGERTEATGAVAVRPLVDAPADLLRHRHQSLPIAFVHSAH